VFVGDGDGFRCSKGVGDHSNKQASKHTMPSCTNPASNGNPIRSSMILAPMVQVDPSETTDPTVHARKAIDIRCPYCG
jgi:hypothetical protein